MLEYAPHVSFDCLMRARVQLNWLEQIDKMSTLAETGNFDLLNRELDREKAFFKGVSENKEHPARATISGEAAETIASQLDNAKFYAEKKVMPRIALANLRQTFFNIAVDTAVDCECRRR